jgi:hypothetical protein
MKKLLFLVFVFGAVFLQAQTIQPYDMVPYRKDTLWGFADIAKTVLIQPQFDEIRFFKDEITAVRKGTLWGFIDKHGKTVTPFKYDLAGDFVEGMCQVRSGDIVGYVNNKGKEIIKPAYQFSYEFSEGLAVVGDSVHGKLISKVIDKTGRILLSDLDAASDKFHSGYLPVREFGRSYFIDKNGKKLQLPANAELYFEFAEGNAIVLLRSARTPARPDTIYYLGIINASGKMVSDTVKDVFGFNFSVSSKQSVVSNFTNGFAIVRRSNIGSQDDYSFIDKKGKMSMWFTSVRAFSAEGKALVVSSADSLTRIIDSQFKTITTTIPIIDAGTFSEDMLRFKYEDGKWGYMNARGEVVLRPVYDECTDFSGGVAVVTLNGKKGCINKNGLQFWRDE